MNTMPGAFQNKRDLTVAMLSILAIIVAELVVASAILWLGITIVKAVLK